MKRKHLPYDCNDDRELFSDSFAVASMSDCTGLIPSAPESESEVSSYGDIYDIPLPKTKSNRSEIMNDQNQNQRNEQNQKNNQNQRNEQNQKNNQNQNQRNEQNSNHNNNQSNNRNDRSFND